MLVGSPPDTPPAAPPHTMSSTAFKWALGLDGSWLSWMAFDFATTILTHRGIKNEELSVLHVSAPEVASSKGMGSGLLLLGPGLPQPDRLHAEIDGKNISLRLKMRWVTQARMLDEKAGQTLTQITNLLGSDFLVLGSYGLGKEHESNYLGHVAVTTLKLACANVFIVKQRPIPYPPVGKPAAWVLATDNSPCARHAFDVVLSLMGVGDQLYIFYSAKYESFSKQVKTYHEKQLDMIGRKGTFVFAHVQGQENYADVICRFAEAKCADVMAIGNRGHSKTAETMVHDPSVPNGTLKKLGSVSEFCAEFCKCSLLITKGSGQHD